MLSFKQGGIKYHFLSFWYDSTCDWTPVFRTIGEHSTHFLIAAQTNPIRNNYVKAKTGNTQRDIKCKQCSDKDETVDHIISKCHKLAQKEYKTKHDWIQKEIHWDCARDSNLATLINGWF